MKRLNEEIQRTEAQHERMQEKIGSMKMTFVNALMAVGQTIANDYETGAGLWAQITPEESERPIKAEAAGGGASDPQPKAQLLFNRRLHHCKPH